MAILDAAIVAACRAVIDAQFGAIPSGLTAPQQAAVNNRRQDLAICIAKAGEYVRDNGVVNTTGADPQGGTVTSTGTVT